MRPGENVFENRQQLVGALPLIGRQRLVEISESRLDDPDAFKTVDLDKPTVEKLANGRVTFTWPYATGGSFTLTLDKGGRFVDGKENAQ